ncbi:MAG: extracellular solute-binding protein [Chloroflexi bacterium]|nr:extracellular solute-binding protein [Chloroflexota bacterium]
MSKTYKRAGSVVMLALIGSVMMLVLAACGQEDPTATPVPTATSTPVPGAPTPEPTPTPSAAELFQVEWDALIAAAQAEGQVIIVMGGSSGRNYRPVAEFFQEKFGVEAVVSTGSGTEQANRVLAERQAGSFQVDVMFVGPTSANTRLIPANALDPMEEQFIHPEVLDKSLWFGGKYWWADVEQKYVFTMSADAGPIQLMRYNTDLMTQEDLDSINSVWDYVDLKWAGKIVSLSPLTGGAGGTYYEAYVHPEIGREWVDAFVDPALDVTFVDDFRFIVDGVAKGQFHFGIAIGSAGRDLDALSQLGAPVDQFPCNNAGGCVKEFKEGGVMGGTGSQNNFMIPTNRPNPSAAKLFVNWMLSQEGQTIMHTLAEQDPDQSLRTDVTDLGRTLEFERRDPNREYFFFSSDPGFTELRAEALQYAKDAYNAVR